MLVPGSAGSDCTQESSKIWRTPELGSSFSRDSQGCLDRFLLALTIFQGQSVGRQNCVGLGRVGIHGLQNWRRRILDQKPSPTVSTVGGEDDDDLVVISQIKQIGISYPKLAWVSDIFNLITQSDKGDGSSWQGNFVSEGVLRPNMDEVGFVVHKKPIQVHVYKINPIWD